MGGALLRVRGKGHVDLDFNKKESLHARMSICERSKKVISTSCPSLFPPEPEPPTLLRRRTSLTLVLILLHPLALIARGDLGRLPPGIVDVVPRDVQEDGLDGDEGQRGRVLDDVVEVDAGVGVLVEPVDERDGAVDGVRGVGPGRLLLEVDEGAVALDLAVELGLEGVGRVVGDFDVERGARGLLLRRGGERGGRALGEDLCVVEEGEGVDVVLGERVRAGDGEGPGIPC